MDNNVTLVVFEDVKERIMKMLLSTKQKLEEGKFVNNASITIDELDKLIKLSDKKIVKYSDLIKRDIESVKSYWGVEME